MTYPYFGPPYTQPPPPDAQYVEQGVVGDWKALQGKPFITVGPGNTGDYDYDASTPGTGTLGLQEAIVDAVANNLELYIAPGTYDITSAPFLEDSAGYYSQLQIPGTTPSSPGKNLTIRGMKTLPNIESVGVEPGAVTGVVIQSSATGPGGAHPLVGTMNFILHAAAGSNSRNYCNVNIDGIMFVVSDTENMGGVNLYFCNTYHIGYLPCLSSFTSSGQSTGAGIVLDGLNYGGSATKYCQHLVVEGFAAGLVCSGSSHDYISKIMVNNCNVGIFFYGGGGYNVYIAVYDVQNTTTLMTFTTVNYGSGNAGGASVVFGLVSNGDGVPTYVVNATNGGSSTSFGMVKVVSMLASQTHTAAMFVTNQYFYMLIHYLFNGGGNSGAETSPTPTLTPNPPVTATQYQNLNFNSIRVYLPAYASTSGTDGTVAVAMGAKSGSLTTILTKRIAGGTSSTDTDIVEFIIPGGWWYELTLSGVTLAAAVLQQV